MLFRSDRSGKTRKVAITLHPSETSRASKTGEYDETIVVDWAWLAQILITMKKDRPAHAPLVPVDAKELQELFEWAQVRLGPDRVLSRQTQYVLRHSGPSADVWESRRPLDEVQKRGRWKAPTSVRRYEKGGRLPERLSKCEDHVLTYATKCDVKLGDVLSGHSAPLRPP